jgi:Holliday junction DNA helicase RuvB
MEDYSLDIIIGKGPSARTLRLDLPKFTLIGATTRIASLSSPLRDRFGMLHRLEFYQPKEVEQILARSARILNISLSDEAKELISHRARRTPRIANRLLKRIRDFAQVDGKNSIDQQLAVNSLENMQIDRYGLDEIDRKILLSIIEKFKGGPVGLSTVAASVAEEKETVEDVYEPYLIQLGLIERTSRGRKVTDLAYQHLGISNKNDI